MTTCVMKVGDHDACAGKMTLVFRLGNIAGGLDTHIQETYTHLDHIFPVDESVRVDLHWDQPIPH